MIRVSLTHAKAKRRDPELELPLTIAEIESVRRRLGDRIYETPTWRWQGPVKDQLVGRDTEVFVKFEMLQVTGSFKPRGALNVMLQLSEQQRARGVAAISAGNHAIAVCYAAQVTNTHAKVVMPGSAPQLRIKRCEELGAEIVLVDNIQVGFERVKEIEREEHRVQVHPFEGPHTTAGIATLGLEFYRQTGGMDLVVIPIGGGGLASGMSTAIKLCNPQCEIYGVEPTGANTMFLSFRSGRPESIDEVRTIASSLGAPYAMPFSFGICRQNLADVVLVSDDDMCGAMAMMFHHMKLAVEPAAAASLAALLGPLKSKARHKRIGIIACGANIDRETFDKYIERGETRLTV